LHIFDYLYFAINFALIWNDQPYLNKNHSYLSFICVDNYFLKMSFD
jgi:hypothetical protein